LKQFVIVTAIIDLKITIKYYAIFFAWRGRGYLVPLGMVANRSISSSYWFCFRFKDATVQIYVVEFITALLCFYPFGFTAKSGTPNNRAN